MELSNHLTSFFEVIAKLPQKKIAQAISGLLLVYIAYVAAQATWLLAPKHNAVDRSGNVVTYYAPVQQKQNINVKKLIQLHIFGEYNAVQQTAEVVVEVPDAPETKLNLTLSAAVASDKEHAAAIIEHKGSQETYGIGDTITGTKVTLEQVLHDRVLIKQSGRMETLMLDGFDYQKLSGSTTKPIAQPHQKNTSSVDKAKQIKNNVIDMRKNRELSRQAGSFQRDLNENPGKIADYLRIVPKRTNGNVVGYRVMPGKQPEFFKSSGLKPGDLVVQMNGHDLTVASEAAQALMSLKQEQEVSLLVQRKDEMTEILFSIDN